MFLWLDIGGNSNKNGGNSNEIERANSVHLC